MPDSNISIRNVNLNIISTQSNSMYITVNGENGPQVTRKNDPFRIYMIPFVEGIPCKGWSYCV